MVSALMSARARGQSALANLALVKVGPIRGVLGYEEGAIEQAEKYGYPIEEFILHPSEMTPERLREILHSRGVRGIILMPVPVPGTDLHFDFEGFATVALGYSVAHNHLTRVISDAYGRVLDAVRHLEMRGFTRIGIVNGPEMDRRFNFGMRAAAEVAPHVISSKLSVPTLMLEGANEYTHFDSRHRKQLREWIRKKRPQVVMSQLYHLTDVLREEGFRIPDDLAYLHLHAHRDPYFASMDQMCWFAGRKAVDIVVAAINRNEFSLPQYPYYLSVPSNWRDGPSVPERADFGGRSVSPRSHTKSTQ